ncbi:MAG: hypothetical protein EOP10_16015 [Proteobacteria bacterium]|nr:MAG: hypothetical protein EOP10_16015 [Pseudomonadota bacterium]
MVFAHKLRRWRAMRMTIKNRDFIFVDFQTTGTVAARSDIIEAGWGLYRAELALPDHTWTTFLIALDNQRQLSRTIQKLTGLSADYYREAPAITPAELKERLKDFLDEHKATPIVIHYAQFKVPFLLKALEEESFSGDRIICVHKLSKQLMPGLKSYSLRAVAGFMGYHTAEKKRSLDHLNATATIWSFLSDRITGDTIPEDLVPWLKTYQPAVSHVEALPIHDQELRKKRLSLPHRPGVYFFLDRAQNVLYVGKAADLHHRVNSYFRGRKTKGSRLNEMLTRAVDFRYVEVESELEALLRENDEIKQIDPPYNRLLRVEGRSVQAITFNSFLSEPRTWGFRPYGPIASLWMVEALRPFIQGGAILPFIPAFMNGITEGMIQQALENLFLSYDLPLNKIPLADDWYELALKAWPLEHQRLSLKQQKVDEDVLAIEVEEEYDEEELLEEAEKVWTVEDIEDFIKDAFLHLYRQILRSRWYLRLAHSVIEWEFAHTPGKTHRFHIRCGTFHAHASQEENIDFSYAQRLKCFDMQVYDRIGIIYAELRKGIKRGDKIRLHLSSRLVLDEGELLRRVRP